jgi:uncharacterized membrane protein
MSARALFRIVSPLALAGLCALAGCGPRSRPAIDTGHEHGHEHEHQASGATCPTSDAPTAQGFGLAFMRTYCLSCHSASVKGAARAGAPEDMNYDTLEDVRRWASEIDEHAAVGPAASNTAMPPAPNPQPTTDERLRLGQWLACGSP